VMLVTTAWHMPRSALLFRREGVECNFFPVDYRIQPNDRVGILDFIPKADALHNTETALREYYGYWFYSVSTWWKFKKPF